MPSLDCASLAGSESFAQNFIGSVSNPKILWIIASFLIFMTLIRRTLFPCVTLRGLESTIKSVDTLLKEHMGLGILPLNVASGISTSTDFCFVYGLGRGMLDCNKYMPHDRRLLDHGDPEHSLRYGFQAFLDGGTLTPWSFVIDAWTLKNNYVDAAHDLRLKSSSTFLKRHFRLSIPSPYTISFTYRQINALKQEIEHSIVCTLDSYYRPCSPALFSAALRHQGAGQQRAENSLTMS
ncbi:hypothetical protein BDP27DRAFT_1359062 [Rhodocollybia butyracea]|uniref:Uncharacterized protein n=1 Tax=Rhodocollybia butyracea TaxID=206335 RepID=A0A9P5Q5M4_9AGAR|nr:hypothetical protein BDP27DRAFT_1359062 [Rhodocollybia butyracea]